MRRYICFSLLFNLLVSSAFALSIRTEGSGSAGTFEVTYQDLQTPLVIVLQVANDSASTVSVLSWQLIDLELRPLAGAQGNLLFQAATAPPDSLFGQIPGPNSDLTSPSARVSASDVDPNFVGEPLTQNSSRNILQLAVGATPGTSGAFQLVIPLADDPEVDSSWFDLDEGTAKAFGNSAASAFPGLILLGTINVEVPVFAPGDYNLDGAVNAIDYSQWRAEFGNIVGIPGDGADGNRNGTVDAADYVIWRDNTDPQSGLGGNVSGATVPEPGGSAVVIIGLACMAGFLCRLSPCRCRHCAKSKQHLKFW